MNYYRHHIGDYARDTAHLSMVEDAAYRRMLDLYYATERPLPALDPLCRLIRARSREERAAVAQVLSEFFFESDGGWHQKRCDTEIAARQEKAETNRVNGRVGGRPKTKPKDNPQETQSVSDQNPKETLANSQEPLAKSQKEKTSAFALPDWVPAAPWTAWLEVRKKLKAPNTDYALTCAVKDLERLRDAGDDPSAVLDKATARGWRGLFPLNGAGTPDYSAAIANLKD